MKKKIQIFYEVFADEENVNAQSLNARGIALKLDADKFACSFLVKGKPDPRLVGRANMRLMRLPPRFRSLFVGLYLLCSSDDLLAYPNQIYHPELFFRVLSRNPRRKKIVFPLEMPLDFIKSEDPKAFEHIRRLLTGSDLVVPITEYTARVLKQETGIEASTIIPLGIDTRFFAPVERNRSRRLRILFVGRLIARKGPEEVLKAARVFPDHRFQIVGMAYGREDGVFARQMQRRAQEEGLENVEFLGKLSQAQLRQRFWEADILLHPSRYEGIPRVTLEAASTGLPCIVYDAYQTPSVVNGVTGFQVRTFPEMIDRLQMLVQDAPLRKRMGAGGIELARGFDWGILAHRWEKVFTELIAESPVAACSTPGRRS